MLFKKTIDSLYGITVELESDGSGERSIKPVNR